MHRSRPTSSLIRALIPTFTFEEEWVEAMVVSGMEPL